jgi:ribosomal-protein-alanine N-acetyltransferase
VREILPVICSYGFKELQLHRIEAIVETENIRSKNIMMSSGFNYEGTLTECEFKNGRYISLDYFAKLSDL